MNHSVVKFWGKPKPQVMDEIQWVLNGVDGDNAPTYMIPKPAVVIPGLLTPKVMTKVGLALNQAKKIVAIKEVCFATNWGLKECKDFVEWLIDNTDLWNTQDYEPDWDRPPF